MPDKRGFRRATMLQCILLIVGMLGCDEQPQDEQPQIASADQPATESGVQFLLSDYEVHYLEVSDNGTTVAYNDPVLLVELTIGNTGEDEFIYNPTHSASQLSKSRTPLLFADPAPGSEEIDWEDASLSPVAAVELEAGSWDGQKRESASLGPGDTVTDYFLFELPEDEEGPMMLSIPPVMHRGEMPLYLRFDYNQPGPRFAPTGGPTGEGARRR